MSEETQIKGTGLRSVYEWMQQQYSAEAMANMVASCSDQTQAIVGRRIMVGSWYPVSALSDLLDAIAQDVPYDPLNPNVHPVYQAGQYVGETNLNTVYKFLLNVVKPSAIISLMPRIWSTYFKGPRVVIDKDACTPTKHVFAVQNTGEIHQISLASRGWLDVGYVRAGATGLRLRESEYSLTATNPDELRIEISWDANQD